MDSLNPYMIPKRASENLNDFDFATYHTWLAGEPGSTFSIVAKMLKNVPSSDNIRFVISKKILGTYGTYLVSVVWLRKLTRVRRMHSQQN
jgi:hypothetical protein